MIGRSGYANRRRAARRDPMFGCLVGGQPGEPWLQGLETVCVWQETGHAPGVLEQRIVSLGMTSWFGLGRY
jgi:hypothetical protein